MNHFVFLFQNVISLSVLCCIAEQDNEYQVTELDGYRAKAINNCQTKLYNSIFITASVTVAIILVPIGIAVLCIRRRKRTLNSLKSNWQSETEVLPTNNVDASRTVYDEIIEEGSGFKPKEGDNVTNQTPATIRGSYQTINDAMVYLHAYQTINVNPSVSSNDVQNELCFVKQWPPLFIRKISKYEHAYGYALTFLSLSKYTTRTRRHRIGE